MASDTVGDLGGSIDLSWTLSALMMVGVRMMWCFMSFLGSVSSESDFELLLETVAAGVDSYIDTDGRSPALTIRLSSGSD